MRQFWKQTFASLVGSIAGLILFFALGAGGLAVLLITLASRDQGVEVADKSVLTFDLSTQISETEPPLTITQALSGEDTDTVTLRRAVNSIEKAAQDERISALFLDGSQVGSSSTGYAILQEVRTALEEFRDAGKPIIAYDVDWGEKQYYLGSVADTVVLNPIGTIKINGLSSQQTFFGGALEQYGVGVQIARAGQYKSAVEPFTRQNFSSASRQQLNELLDDIWGEFLSAVGEGRELTPQELQVIANNQAILSPEQARSAGLVDQVAYFDQVAADLKELSGNGSEGGSFRKVSLSNYADNALEQRSSENEIALLYAEGAIVNGQGGIQQVGSDRFAEKLRQLREHENVKAVVLRINSPGGSATASEVILRQVQLTSKQKPVIVSMGNKAASGGYWIASGADQIFAESTTLTGSIGVFGLLPNVEEIANENGITWGVVKTSDLANINTIIRPKTKQELQVYQEQVERIYNTFLDKVVKYRNIPRERASEIAQGRIWSGQDAQNIGLVDQIGGLNTAIKFAAQKAKLGEDWEIQVYPEQRSLRQEVLKRLAGDVKAQGAKQLDPLNAELLKLKEDLAAFKNLNDPKGIYARLPFMLRIK